jgi:nucleoside-diphosphate-sugar epimerase
VKVLVLGGSGLISQSIVAQLDERGDEVWVFNRGRTPAPLPAAVMVRHGSRADGPELAALAAGGRFDAVIDMICFTAADARIAVEAFGGRVPQYVMCSTVDVYTKPARYYPVDEAHERDPSPAFRYAFDKQAAEAVLEAAHAAGSFALTVLRPAATYASHVVAPLGTMDLYVGRLRQDRPVILPGDGTSLWVACHRDDVARAFVRSLGNPSALGTAYNVASSELMTWDTYWRTFARALGIDSPRFLHVPTDVLASAVPALSEWCAMNFHHNNIIDSSLARRDLDFASTVPWAEGARMVAQAWVPGPVDQVLASRYDQLVEAWQRSTERLVAELGGEQSPERPGQEQGQAVSGS